MIVLKCRLIETLKPHTCYGCDRRFKAGSTLTSQTLATDEEISITYWCDSCLQLMGEFRVNGERGMGQNVFRRLQ